MVSLIFVAGLICEEYGLSDKGNRLATTVSNSGHAAGRCSEQMGSVQSDTIKIYNDEIHKYISVKLF